jgi:DNA-binding NarL/FixJ family response regulator
MGRVSIALVDDHPLMVEAVRSVLGKTNLFQVVASGSAARDVVEIGTAIRPDVMLVDLGMVGDIYAAISTVTRQSSATKIVVFTAATGVECAIRALDSGASGYVLKGCSSEELIGAINSSLSGEVYIAGAFAAQVIAALRDANVRRKAADAVRLSIREEQIIRLLLKGKTNKEIANAINLCEKTVRHYMTILMQKLQVRNRLEAVIAAKKLEADQRVSSTYS